MRTSENYPGPVSAQSFQTSLVGDPTKIPQTIKIKTNGTTPVDVFGTTNGVAGSFTGIAKVIPMDSTIGIVTLKQNIGGSETTVFTVNKGGVQGSFNGTYFAGVAFDADGTAQVVSSTAGNAIVEIDFVVSNPALPGAQ